MQPRKVLPELPTGLKHIIGAADMVPDTIGWSQALVFYLPQLKSYLKIASSHNIPEPLAYKRSAWWLGDDCPSLKCITTSAPMFRVLVDVRNRGLRLCQEAHRQHPDELVRLLAAGLKEMHSLEISDCPFDQTLEAKLNKVRAKLERGLVDEDDLERRQQVQDLYDVLLAAKPASEDLVFTHGDYCLPNIILKDGRLSGFIDLGRAGVADRYVDLALAVRSLQYNGYGAPQLLDLFFHTYGLKDIDQAKMKFYTLLDEFV